MCKNKKVKYLFFFRNSINLENYLSNFLIVYLIFVCSCGPAAMDQAEYQARAEAKAQAQAACVEVESYVTPELLDREIDRRHRLFLSAVLGEDVGHVCSRTKHMLLSIHDFWVPSKTDAMLLFVPSFILLL
jgi:hypothetical protein